jgi:hypothetical protein
MIDGKTGYYKGVLGFFESEEEVVDHADHCCAGFVGRVDRF